MRCVTYESVCHTLTLVSITSRTLSFESSVSLDTCLLGLTTRLDSDIYVIHLPCVISYITHTATHCNTLQHTVTQYNTVQHSATLLG